MTYYMITTHNEDITDGPYGTGISAFTCCMTDVRFLLYCTFCTSKTRSHLTGAIFKDHALKYFATDLSIFYLKLFSQCKQKFRIKLPRVPLSHEVATTLVR